MAMRRTRSDLRSVDPDRRGWQPDHEAVIDGTDGGQLYTSATGSGPTIVLCNGLGVAASSFWGGIVDPLSRTNRVVTWDYRGHGRSGAPEELHHLSLQQCANDLGAVLDHWSARDATIAGHSMGVQVALRFYRDTPDRVSALVSLLGTFERPIDRLLRFPHSAATFESLAAWADRHPSMTARVWPRLFHPWLARPVATGFGLVRYRSLPSGELEAYLNHLRRMNPAAFIELARSMQATSERDVLPKVRVPMLIFAGTDDVFTPIEVSREMHELAPGSVLLEVPGGTHTAFAEQPDVFWRRISAFLVANGVWPDGAEQDLRERAAS